MNRKTLQRIATLIGASDYAGASIAIYDAMQDETGAHWLRDMDKLLHVLSDLDPRFTVIRRESGAGKLGKGFLAFNVLPGVTCPGAGECLDFCYSYKAWRYPAAFCRQAQNTILMQSNREAIVDALRVERLRWVKNGIAGPIDFRLYVDGDFSSMDDVQFWMDTLAANDHWLNCYGYSKSFSELVAWNLESGGNWPTNYTLNLSSGHKHGSVMAEYVSRLPIARGSFTAVQTPTHWRQADYGSREYNAELVATHKANTGRKAFPCPGKCGECRTIKGENSHACGDQSVQADIIIAMH